MPEVRALLALALPLIAGNIAWAGIAMTDLLLLGRIGPDAIAAGALGINVYSGLLVAGMGLVTAASPLIASERGRRPHAVREVRRTVRQTMWSAAAFCLPCWLLLWHAGAILHAFAQDAALSAGAVQLLRGLQWAMLPYLCFLCLRNYLAALERPGWGLAVMLSALPINLLAGWCLIFGHLGLPPLGLFGAGLASSVSAAAMLLMMLAVVSLDRSFRRYHLLGRFWRADWPRFRQVWRIGLPIAVTVALEATVFNAAVFLMGLIDRPSLAAHAIVIQIATFAFMVPLGLGQAVTVRVGFAFGRRDKAALGRAGWTGLALAFGYGCLTATAMLALPGPLIGLFINRHDPGNAAIVRLAAGFLTVAAGFQPFDCVQAAGAGALRGLHDTRVPMIVAGVGYWIVGIGTAVLLAFPLGLRGIGVWLGLAAGLGVVAALLLARWRARERLGLA